MYTLKILLLNHANTVWVKVSPLLISYVISKYHQIKNTWHIKEKPGQYVNFYISGEPLQSKVIAQNM